MKTRLAVAVAVLVGVALIAFCQGNFDLLVLSLGTITVGAVGTSNNPADIAQRWANNLGSAGDKIRAGVAAVTESPMAKAAARVDAWVNGVQNSRDKYVAGLSKTTLQQWKDAMTNKGINRVGSGATQAVPKFTQFMSQFMPHIQAGLTALTNQPRGDLSANIGRMVTMVQHLATFRQS